MHLLRLSALVVCLLLGALAPLAATSIFVEGVLVEIKPDGTIVVQGYDHYNGEKKYGGKIRLYCKLADRYCWRN